jgi:uncharacterized repeat protein (TIGR03803 family)
MRYARFRIKENVMNYKKFSGAASAALMIVVIISLVLAPAAWAASKYKTLHRFTGGKDGGDPSGDLIFDQAGNLYSTTQDGGSGSGTVFELTPNQDGSWTKSVLYSFNGSDGVRPLSGLTFDQTGNLYGMTYSGGPYAYGTVFELSPNPDGSWTESVLHSFYGSDGARPVGSVILDAEGSLYGMTTAGGAYGGGTVFKLTPNTDGSWSENLLHSFMRKDGRHPDHGNLVFDAVGNLYGATAGGGNNGVGTIFKLTPNPDGRWTEQVLHSFSGGRDGAVPESTLIFDKSGNLYGTTRDGGAHGAGVAFELALNTDGTWKEKVLHQFAGGKDGATLYEGLIFDQAGNLYGTTMTGGNLSVCGGRGCGVAFRLAPNSNGGWNETVLHTFMDHPGAFSNAALIFDTAGNLYGTTAGYTAHGSVFEITP